MALNRAQLKMTYQFYPTGERLAAKAWAKFKNPVSHLCEPSAGQGHLIRYAKEGFPGLTEDELPWLEGIEDEVEVTRGGRRFRTREYARNKFSHIDEISVVEIDVRHHANLKELGAKVIGFDFMEVQSLATCRQILMNPPFQHGCAHVLHAWDCVYDAEIVAIVNAETVRNPFSAERQRLVQLIAQHGSVEFLQDEFVDDVERKTQVEVALIHLEKVPSQYVNFDALTSGLRRGDNGVDDLDPEICTALSLPGNFLQDTYHRFVQAVETARKASEALALANHMAGALGITLEEMQAKGVGGDFRHALDSVRNAANTEFKGRYNDLKKRAWAQILRSSLLTNKLSNQARRQLESEAANIYELEFTLGNIHGFLAGVIQSMGDIYTNMLVDMFDSIIERSGDNVVFYRSWKSNKKHRIGMRLRKSRFILPRFRVGYGGGLDYESERFLADIDLCWGYLFGVSGEYDGIVQAMRGNKIMTGERYTSRFFDFRLYKGTGTIHFYPKNAEVMDKMNRFVGKIRNWIPGDMAEANSDFERQYERGEAFSEEYLAIYRKSFGGYRSSSPHYAMLRDLKDRSEPEYSRELEKLDAAIEEVHEQHGLRCRPLLGAGQARSAIEGPSNGMHIPPLLLAA